MEKWVLDLYCGVGGATRGYQARGYKVFGVDKIPQPHYCGDGFALLDALEFLELFSGARFCFVHASPPCEEDNTLTKGTNDAMGWGSEHEQLVPATRMALEAWGLPFVLEQPSNGSQVRRDLMLCMDMFRFGEPPWVQRHRDFELHGISVPPLVHPKHVGYVRGYNHYGYQEGPYIAGYGNGGGKGTISELQYAMQMNWAVERQELVKAIPPAYTNYIGRFIP